VLNSLKTHEPDPLAQVITYAAQDIGGRAPVGRDAARCRTGARASQHRAATPSGPTACYVRCCQAGTGYTGAVCAASLGSTTTGWPLRFWMQAEAMRVFWPLASKVIGPPIIM